MMLTMDELARRVAAELRAAGANAAMADSTARALTMAEAQQLGSHGLSRLPQYTAQLRNGRVVGAAQACVARRKGAALLIDAGEGLAFPACELAVAEAIAVAREHGIRIQELTPTDESLESVFAYLVGG